MKRLLILLPLILFVHCLTLAQVSFSTRQFRLGLSNEGRLSGLTSILSNTSYLPSNVSNALLTVKMNGKELAPVSLQWKAKPGVLTLSYPGNIQASVRVVQQQDYITMELTQLTNAADAEWIKWGPFPTTIADTIGEVVGVVRNKDFAIGIQALNVKTLGGSPEVDSDIQPTLEVNEQLLRGDVAKATPYGSLIQAYCRNRNKDRVIDNWSHPRYLAPAFTQDGGVVGSKLAIFGVATPQVLKTISAIELKENLPHPLLDGVWGKTAPRATESYLIMDFGTNTISEALALTQKAGLRYLYHSGPFDTWGHFKMNTKEFPDNWASMKSCVDIANAQQMRLGLHTLSNFITTNDTYVTPIPDARLARVGYSVLATNADAAEKEIAIKDPAYFNQFANNTLKAVVVGSEIIRYTSVSASAPWKLLDCQRGAYGTSASAHKAGDSIGKLMDHPYQVFLGNYELDQEMAKTIARMYNETGLMQISFDGLEGCWSEGMGDYGKQLFVKTWFENLSPALKGKVINDASNPGHYFWHIYTRMNWGEPWYAGFRESQLQLRLRNQQFYRRNLMPSMLGWFSLKAETSLEDIEWMLARGAGFDAGFGLSTRLETMKKHGRINEVLETIKLWEDARLKGMFTPSQKLLMEDTRNEFHLEKTSTGDYHLVPVHNAHLVHEQKIRQPGEPVFSTFDFRNPHASQPAAFIITMSPKKDSDLEVTFSNPVITINQQEALTIPVSLKYNQYLYCDGKEVKLYDRQWQLLQTIGLTTQLPSMVNGSNQVSFDGKFSGENGGDLKIELRVKGVPEKLKAAR